jgi:hypothetical protein
MLVSMVVVVACGPEASATHSYVQLPLLASVRTDHGVTGVARLGDGRLVLLTGPREGELLAQTYAGDTPGTLSLGFLTVGGEAPSRTYYSWVFGSAPAGASRFVATPEGVGGEVVGGVFVYGMRPKSMPVDDLVWSFVNRGGAVILRGRGLTADE